MEPKKPIRIDELTNEHPLRQLPFTVPEGYFDALPSRVQAETLKRSHRFSINWTWQRTAASLAGAGLVAVLVWVTYPQKQESLGPDALSDVSNRAIVEYLNDQALSTEDLADVAPANLVIPTESTLLDFLEVSPQAIEAELEAQGARKKAI